MALTTLAEIKCYLDISAATWDTVLTSLWGAAEKRITNHCGVDDLASATYTEYYDGRGQGRLVVKHRPIISITSIHDDFDRDYEDADLVDADDYTFYPDAGIVEKDAGVFQDGIRNVKIIYVAGYATVPDDLQLAVWKLVAALWNQMRQGADGITTEREADYQAAYEKIGLPEDVRALLAPYRNIGI